MSYIATFYNISSQPCKVNHVPCGDKLRVSFAALGAIPIHLGQTYQLFSSVLARYSANKKIKVYLVDYVDPEIAKSCDSRVFVISLLSRHVAFYDPELHFYNTLPFKSLVIAASKVTTFANITFGTDIETRITTKVIYFSDKNINITYKYPYDGGFAGFGEVGFYIFWPILLFLLIAIPMAVVGLIYIKRTSS